MGKRPWKLRWKWEGRSEWFENAYRFKADRDYAAELLDFKRLTVEVRDSPEQPWRPYLPEVK
jgi:hypothetical protein